MDNSAAAESETTQRASPIPSCDARDVLSLFFDNGTAAPSDMHVTRRRTLRQNCRRN
jgi:hypothetical protein